VSRQLYDGVERNKIKKEPMNFSGTENVERSQLKVVSFINRRSLDFLQDFPELNLREDPTNYSRPPQRQDLIPSLVQEHQFPDQSIYRLQEQLKLVKSNLGRIKFYLEELEDILPP
jgi:hypothetical protein